MSAVGPLFNLLKAAANGVAVIETALCWEFEIRYETTRRTPFPDLFDQPIPEMPLVEF